MSIFFIAFLAYAYVLTGAMLVWSIQVAGTPYSIRATILRVAILPLVFPFLLVGDLLRTALK